MTIEELTDWNYKRMKNEVNDRQRPLLKALIQMKCKHPDFDLSELFADKRTKGLFDEQKPLEKLYEGPIGDWLESMVRKLGMKCSSCGHWNRVLVSKIFVKQNSSKSKVKILIPMCEPLEVSECKKCGKIIAEPKEFDPKSDFGDTFGPSYAAGHQSKKWDHTNPSDFLDSLMVVAHSPVDLCIEDSLGRRLGVDQTGQLIAEIPEAIYSGPDVELETIQICNPTGEYRVQVYGHEDGTYDLEVFTGIGISDRQLPRR